MEKLLILVDGDNIDETYTDRIFEKASEYGEIYEAHCFCDFVMKKKRWDRAYTKYMTSLHFIPGSDKKKGKPDPNTSDIALATFAVKKLYQSPEIDTCIIVSNDKDFIPLAKTIRADFHKKAVMFYSQQADKAIESYNSAVCLLDDDSLDTEAVTDSSVKPDTAVVIKKDLVPQEVDYTDFKTCITLVNIIEELFDKYSHALLAEVSPRLTDNGIEYTTINKKLGNYLKKMFDKHSVLRDNYELKLGDKKDRIERKTK